VNELTREREREIPTLLFPLQQCRLQSAFVYDARVRYTLASSGSYPTESESLSRAHGYAELAEVLNADGLALAVGTCDRIICLCPQNYKCDKAIGLCVCCRRGPATDAVYVSVSVQLPAGHAYVGWSTDRTRELLCGDFHALDV